MTAEYSGMIEVNHIFEQSPRIIPLESEEEKIRTIASMIPLLGIYIAHRYPLRSTIRGRVIGSMLTLLLIIASITSSEGGFILGLTVILSILIFVILSVNILLK